jgi:hypothetical protein
MNAYLREELPLTQAMGIRVVAWDGRTVELGARHVGVFIGIKY